MRERSQDDWTALSLSTCRFLLRWWEVGGAGAEEEFALRPMEVEMSTWRCGQTAGHRSLDLYLRGSVQTMFKLSRQAEIAGSSTRSPGPR